MENDNEFVDKVEMLDFLIEYWLQSESDWKDEALVELIAEKQALFDEEE